MASPANKVALRDEVFCGMLLLETSLPHSLKLLNVDQMIWGVVTSLLSFPMNGTILEIQKHI
jgi:hypothetical protein